MDPETDVAVPASVLYPGKMELAGAKIPCSLEKPVAMTIQMLMWRVLLPALLASWGRASRSFPKRPFRLFIASSSIVA